MANADQSEWRKNKYKRLVIDLEKKEAEEFLKVLENQDIAFQAWAKDQIKLFMAQRKEKRDAQRKSI